jgi:tRNA (guanine37-N1)-methyltransferase
MVGFDVLGNIAILKFPDKTSAKEKKKEAARILSESITTVLEKREKVKGRLRTIKTNFLAGKKTKEALYRESGCLFKLNIEKCYFSPRLSGERLEVAGKIKRSDKVLVLFAGVAPFPIVIAKKTGAKVVSVELGKECSKYARENVKLNKLGNVKIVQGDVKKLGKLIEKGKYDKIIMARPQLKDTFLKYVWSFCKKGTEIFYYDFGKDVNVILKKIEKEAKIGRMRIKIFEFRKAGDIAPYKYRWLVRFIVN